MQNNKKQINDLIVMKEVVKFFKNTLSNQNNKPLVEVLKNEAMAQYCKGDISASEHCTIEAWLDHYLYEV